MKPKLLLKKIVKTQFIAPLIKPQLIAALLAMALLLGGCYEEYNDSALWEEVNEHAARLADLEKWVETVNGNISALQTVVAALQNNDYVTGVTPFNSPDPGGYYIDFTKSGRITIWNGAKGETGETGEKGHSPQIGVAKDTDGKYYWTLDDDGEGEHEWLTDGEGNKIPATGEQGATGTSGVTPQLRINDATNEWEICTNGACTGESDWTSTGVPATGEQGDAIFAAGGIDYTTSDDYVEFTLADGTTTIQVPKYRPLNIDFGQPSVFTYGETKNISFTTTGNVQRITAVDVPRGWTVAPNTASSVIAVTAPADDGKYYTAAGTVTLLVSDGAERTITAPLALACPAYVPPAPLGIAFEQPGGFLSGETKNIGFTLTGGATAVKALDVPQDWTVAVSTSGSAGTFTVTAPATWTDDNLSGEALIFVTDDAGNTVVRALKVSGTPPGAASTQVWKFGSQTWSDRITVPDCNKSAFSGGATDCRSYNDNGTLRYYYGWNYVNSNQSTMCPSPWRVPSQSDFITLAGNTTYTALTDAWGFGGFAGSSSLNGVPAQAYYWSTTENNSDYAYYLYCYSGSLDVRGYLKYYGFQVRCVK